MKKNELSLGEAIREFLEVHNLNDGFLQTEIYQRWDELAGRAVNVKTRKISFRNGHLTVYLSSSTLRNELSLRKTELLQRLNDRLKGRPVKSIEFQ